MTDQSGDMARIFSLLECFSLKLDTLEANRQQDKEELQRDFQDLTLQVKQVERQVEEVASSIAGSGNDDVEFTINRQVDVADQNRNKSDYEQAFLENCEEQASFWKSETYEKLKNNTQDRQLYVICAKYSFDTLLQFRESAGYTTLDAKVANQLIMLTRVVLNDKSQVLPNKMKEFKKLRNRFTKFLSSALQSHFNMTYPMTTGADTLDNFIRKKRLIACRMHKQLFPKDMIHYRECDENGVLSTDDIAFAVPTIEQLLQEISTLLDNRTYNANKMLKEKKLRDKGIFKPRKVKISDSDSYCTSSAASSPDTCSSSTTTSSSQQETSSPDTSISSTTSSQQDVDTDLDVSFGDFQTPDCKGTTKKLCKGRQYVPRKLPDTQVIHGPGNTRTVNILPMYSAAQKKRAREITEDRDADYYSGCRQVSALVDGDDCSDIEEGGMYAAEGYDDEDMATDSTGYQLKRTKAVGGKYNQKKG